ncbi:amidohydrolase family protein [uncultured Martelella sp.]|uniref:amidohydrolase family protein n=1 Tax=uncultured Martelella sp. TaxID=392331 RepID=UPI0029C87F54|nr:amidohydrolase family protein [uncultured Martelella sp.]
MNQSDTTPHALAWAQFDPARATLVKQAIIISGSDKGTFRGDLLLRDGHIFDIGPELDIGDIDAEIIDASSYIVSPGFIDTHRHLWLSAFKGLSYDSHLADVFANLYGVYSPRFRPQDHYAITRLARLAALDAGVTTMLDWAHNIASPEHEDAAIQAHRDIGGRTVFGHGYGSDRLFDVDRYYDQARSFAGAERTRKLLPDDDALLSSCFLGLEPPQLISLDACKREFEIARELGMRISIHIVSADRNFQPCATLEMMYEAGMMGPDVTWVHLTGASDHELKLIAETGGSASVAPHVDSHFMSPPPTGRLMAAGIRPSLSIDSANAASEDFFSQMRTAFGVERTISMSGFEERPEGFKITLDDIFEFATFQGARALGQEKRLGTIEPGKVADLLFIDTTSPNMVPVLNPVASVVFHASIGDIDTVLVHGKPVKRGGKLLADLDDVRHQAEDTIDHLFWQAQNEIPKTATRPHPAARSCACHY